MNKRQVIVLWIIALVLGAAVAFVKLRQDQTIRSVTDRAAGETLFTDFPAAEVTEIEIAGPDKAVHLAKKSDKWVVADRADFPANPTYVNDLLRTLGELKVTQGMQAGPSFAPRFGMDPAASKLEEHGLIATFKNASGSEVAKVALGKNIDSGAQANPMMGGGSVGRYVRNFADESGFYAVSEMFPSVTADPARWLSDGFISPEKIQTIAVSQPGKPDIAWKLTRENEAAEFKLEGATGDEVVNTEASAPFKSLFSYARFNDVVPAADAAEQAVAGQTRTVTLTTIEGFTYQITLTPAKPKEKPPTPVMAGEPPEEETVLMTVSVSADLPQERKKEEGEKPEDAKSKDEAFTSRLKTLSEKLEKEKQFEGVTFAIGTTQVEPLLKTRDELITKAAPVAETTPATNVQSLPGGVIAGPGPTATTPPIEAVTPPIRVPAAGEEIDLSGEETELEVEDPDLSEDEEMDDSSEDDELQDP